jgi:hypothetical protein
MKLADIRTKYPEYDDVNDRDLTTALHKKFYSDMPFEDFSKRLGYGQEEIPRSIFSVPVQPEKPSLPGPQFRTRPRDIRQKSAQLGALGAAKQIVPQFVGGVEETIGTLGSLAQWGAERATIGRIAGQHINIKGSSVVAEYLVRKYGPKKPLAFFDARMKQYARMGEKWADWWEEQANKGWEAPDPELMEARWRDRPVEKGAATISRAAPNFLTAIAASVLTKSPSTGLMFISGLSGAGQYRRQRKAGTPKQLADSIALMTAAWEGVTEKVPFDEIFKPSKHLFLKMLKVGTMESAQEFIQGIGENFLEHFGYNARRPQDVPAAVREGFAHAMDNWRDQ